MAKHKETLLEVCTRATLLGNSISVRMLEYLSTVKNLPDGFKDMANDFLELSRILWSIEAGLMESARTKNRFPNDIIQELDLKFRKTNDDFTVLNQMILKFLEYETKGTFGKFQKGWRLMFSGADIEKMRQSLRKDKEALRMSSMMFRLTIGDAKADSSTGIGYTGLVAALERMNSSQPTTVIPPLSTSPPATAIPLDNDTAPQLPPLPISTKNGAGTPLPRYDSLNSPPPPPPPASDGRQSSLHRHHTISSNTPTSRMVTSRYDSGYRDTYSDTATESTLPLDGFVRDSNRESIPVHAIADFKYPTKFIRLKADPSAVPHWEPRPSPAGMSPNSRAALAHAIQNKDRATVEKLLDGGADSSDPALLIRACLNSDDEIVQLLLLFGSDPNAIDANGYSPLFAATKTALMEGAELLLKYGADPNLSAGPDMDSPLAAAVSEGNFDFVHLLLMYGANAGAIMGNGNTPLIKAINKTVSAKIVELMLDYETNPNGKNREGGTALFAAIQAVRLDLMALLLDHGANPNLPAPKHPLWPSTYHSEALQLLLSRGADPKKSPGIMELASSLKNIDSISVLLSHGVSPNIKKDGIYTPLCSAIRDDSVDIVTLLLANGADPNLPASEYPAFKCVTHDRVHILPQLVAAGNDLHNPKGIMETAVAFNNMDAIKFFFEHGVDPNDRSEEGRTALTTAIRENKVELVDYLLAHGADPSIRGEDWPIVMAVKRPQILAKLLSVIHNPSAIRGVIEAAVMANQLESIKMLLKAGVSVEDKTGGVFSPLTTALREDRKDLVRFLLYEAGADPNAPGEHLPLIKAIRRCVRNDTDCIEMLLERGADINKMYRGWSPVLQAVESGNLRILKLLLEKGNEIDLEKKDEDGKTVGEVVIERGWAEAIPLLFPKPRS